MEKIAIIGLSCLLPGAENAENYWQNLIEKKDLTSLATSEEMGVDANLFYDREKGKTDKYYCLRGGYIRDFAFDATEYQVAPEILQELDPIYQWSLYVSRQALQDSGYLANRAVLSNCGVILGNLSFPTRYSHHLFAPIYQQTIASAIQELLQQDSFQLPTSSKKLSPINGLISGYPAFLIARSLSLSGIHFAIDAACASSLYAIELACNYLRSRKADLMLAGAISCADPFFINMGFSIFQAYPEDSKTRPLDRTSGGLIAGEGAGMVVLKRYEDARRDGDRIYATISGIGLSNDGKGKFVLSPNSKGQILAFERAYTKAGINPNRIDYIECHATGTPIGDITELNSMEDFFSRYQAKPLIGSVKSNFGHLLTAAGIAGLIKVIFSLNKEVIPPTINISEPLNSQNGGITADQIVTSPTLWPSKSSIKQAAISAFGFGGTNAHLILESGEDINHNQLKSALSSRKESNPINQKLAIIGMDAFFGACDSLNAFDRAIYQGTQHFIPLPEARWQGIESQSQLLKDYGFDRATPPQGAYIKDFELDFLRCKIPPHQDDRLIPQQLLILKVADNAIKDAGLAEGANVAVIVAMGTELALHQFRGRVDLSWQIQDSLKQANISLTLDQITELETIAKNSLHSPAKVNQYTSFIGNIMACRISALSDFSGPAFTISAEENSVFKALEVAQLLLEEREIDAVVVGAVDLAGGVENVFLRHQLAPINHGTNTFSYDVNVNGWMVGEGAGAVVLKRHEIALENGDRIYATIDAISIGQDRNSSTPLAQLPNTPDAAAVTSTCQQAFELAGIKPKDIGYLEVFGSGISSQDEAEIQGLLSAYKTANNSPQELSCCIGSIKANIGHTYAASGMASLIKIALCLYHRYIPATPQWSKPKSLDLWQGSPFYVAPESRTWFLEETASKRIAAINGLSLDGSYAHLIVSEEISQKERPNQDLAQTGFYLFPLAAESQSDLLERLNSLQKAISNADNLAQVAWQIYQTFQQCDRAPYKLAILGRDRHELLREINWAFSGVQKAFERSGEWKTPLGSYFTATPLAKEAKVAFIYPGQLNSSIGLGKDIFRLFPEIYQTFSTITNRVGDFINEKTLYPRSLEKISTEELQKLLLLNDIAMAQSGISFAVLYTLILRDYFQVQPQAALGYCMGEISMMHAWDIWDDDDNSRHQRSSSPLFTSRLFGQCLTVRELWGLPLDPNYPTASFWSTYCLKTTARTVREVLKDEDRVFLSYIDAPNEVFISGDREACLKIIKKLGCEYYMFAAGARLIHCESVAKHEFNQIAELYTIDIKKDKPNLDFYSGVTCQPIQLEKHCIAQNIAQVLCQTVDFPKLIDSVYQDGVKIFIEVGAGNFCSTKIAEILQDKAHLAVPINLKGVSDRTGIIRLLAKLVSHGVSLNLSPIYDRSSDKLHPEKSTIKTVTLGSVSIHSTILSSANIEKLKHQTNLDMYQQQLLKILQLQIARVLPSNTANKPANIVWDEADLLEFARGNIANVFGEDYRIIDDYSRRVRLPMPPYLLVSRVTKITAEKGQFKPSAITTEYDIPKNAWYAIDGQVPWAITVESGQCDLLLIAYLGIDFENKGELVYRLLDCTLTFLDELPKAEDTLRYDIKINSFVRSGENLLFFFSYECFVGEKMILKMDGGCAGFFSNQQLEQGKGIIVSDKDLAKRKKIQKEQFEPLLVCTKSSFDAADIMHLTQGNLAACFGDHYCQYGLNPSLRLPPDKILMIDRIATVETTGGDWGLGLIIAEKNLEPEHWYFPCHFKDDQVLAGSLMAEGCGQLLQFYLLYLGLHICTKDARFQPIYGLPQVVRCRGQVTPISDKLIYRMEITEIGLNPHPYAKCNVDIILQGKTVVHFQDLGLQLIEKTPPSSPLNQITKNLPTPIKTGTYKSALFSEEQLQEFCTGSVAKCFGKEYKIYDSGTVKASRMPNTHLSLVSRVLEIQGNRHQIKKGSTILTEYDVPLHPWYYRQNSSDTIPYAILMEIGLQPCGFLSAYLGTTLLYPDRNLYFRNLDGSGHLIKDIDIRGKTIANTATLISSTNIQGMILQSFTFQLACDREIFYQGEASFGHFSPEALANQVGLDRGQDLPPWYETENVLNLPKFSIELSSPSNRIKYYQTTSDRPHYRLAQYQLNLLNEVQIIAKGGKYQQGYIYARKDVKPTDWYFKCHFYQDPVMPGSLGVEAMLQAMQVYALHLDLGKHLRSPRFCQLIDHKTVWKYRGQIPPDITEMYLEVHISQIDISDHKIIVIGDASLWKPNMRIYEVKDLAICLLSSDI